VGVQIQSGIDYLLQPLGSFFGFERRGDFVPLLAKEGRFI
jgi:hypothetical protein